MTGTKLRFGTDRICLASAAASASVPSIVGSPRAVSAGSRTFATSTATSTTARGFTIARPSRARIRPRAGVSVEVPYQERLGGAATRQIVIRDRETGAAGKTLLARPGRRARPLRTTLDLRVQAAAEAALAPVDGNAALVAVKPSTGDILAVANRPEESIYDRALTGLYPPGSTFKVISTTALLRAGLDVDRTVACPRPLTVEGKPFRNFEGNAAGAVPFRRDFAQSCNTAFVSLAGELKPDALTDV